jgi:hypothetical protein
MAQDAGLVILGGIVTLTTLAAVTGTLWRFYVKA